MKFNDIFKQAFKNFISNKKNIIILLLIALSCSMVLFTVSFNQSVSNYWENSVKKLVDYRTFFTYYDFNKYEENEAVEKLEKHTNIEDVAPYSSYLITMTANDYIDENKNSVFFLEGTISNPINIIAGERLEDYGNGEKVMICADNFYPYQNESVYDYSRDDLKDFTKRIGEKIPISFIDSEKVEYFKLVGVYDAESNQTNGNLCYTSFQTITSLNLYYQSEVYNQEDVYLPLIMVIDDVDNIDQTLSEIQKDGFFTSGSVLAINTDVGDKIMNITFIIAVIMSILSLILLLILSLKNQEIRKKEFGILKVLGYTNRDISKIQYGESMILFILSFLLAILICNITIYIFEMQFIVNISIFNGMKFTISILALLICFIYCLLMPLLMMYIINKKIKKTTAIDIIRG